MSEIRFSKDHEWVELDGETATVGITDYAQKELGDVTFVELPAVDDDVEAGAEIGTIESVKAAAEVYAPINGTISEVNEALETTPELINNEPQSGGWLIKMTGIDQGAFAALMDDAAYKAFTDGL